jgi:integrase
MARKHADMLKTKTAREALPIRKKPFKTQIAPGIFLAYRRNAGPGTWSVEYPNPDPQEQGKTILRRFGLADDREVANGAGVQTFWQASKTALKLARGSESGGIDVAVTVGTAVDMFESDLIMRHKSPANARSLRGHLPSVLLSRPVCLLTERELADWRHALVANTSLKPTSANRYSKSFKACLSLAARRDQRITNAKVWQNALRLVRSQDGSDVPRTDFYLSDGTVLAIVNACRAEDADFGDLIAVLAGTGCRESQARRLQPHDLIGDGTDTPALMLWRSSKGKDRAPERRAVPITPALAKALRARIIARGPNKPVFDRRIWNVSARFRVVLARLNLNTTLVPYCLRHTSIIRSIRSGAPLRVIAYAHDTSVAEIERVYGRYLGGAVDDLLRPGLLNDAAPAHTGNVVDFTHG